MNITKSKYHNDHDIDIAHGLFCSLLTDSHTSLSLSHSHSPTNSLLSFRDYFTHTLTL